MNTTAELRCHRCGKSSEDIARLHPERVPTVRPDPATKRVACNWCWASEKPFGPPGPRD